LDLSATKDVTLFIIFKAPSQPLFPAIFTSSSYGTNKFFSIRVSNLSGYEIFAQIQGSSGTNGYVRENEPTTADFKVRQFNICNNRVYASRYEYILNDVNQSAVYDAIGDNTNYWNNDVSYIGTYNGALNFLNGYVCEIILYGTDIGTTSSTLVYNYLKTKYGL
jgi:hypothetical protein